MLKPIEGADEAVVFCAELGTCSSLGAARRMYILGGPADLMPEEGLTKKQAQEVKALEVSAFLLVECPVMKCTELSPLCKVHHIILGLRSLQALKYFLSWQAKEARKEREAQVAKVQMEAALSKGVSWGMAGGRPGALL